MEEFLTAYPEPIYALAPLAIGFFLRGSLRLYLGSAVLAGPLLLRLGVAGPANDAVVDAWLPRTVATGLLFLLGVCLARLRERLFNVKT